MGYKIVTSTIALMWKKILSIEQRIKKEVTKIYQSPFLELPLLKQPICKGVIF